MFSSCTAKKAASEDTAKKEEVKIVEVAEKAPVVTNNGNYKEVKVSFDAVATDWHGRMLKIFKAYVEESLQDTYQVKNYTGSTLFKQGTQMTQLQLGNSDIAELTAQAIAQQCPEFSIITAGYIFRDYDHMRKFWDSEYGQDLLDLVTEKTGIHVIGVFYNGTRHLNLRTDKKITTPEDLAGVKLRMPNDKAWMFLGKSLGVNPTPMSFVEVYAALQSGAIDGQDNPLPTDKAAKFYEVTKQIVLTAHMVQPEFIAMSDKLWNSLDERERDIFVQAARAASDFNDKNRLYDESVLADFFRAEGLKVYQPNLEAFRSKVLADYAASEYVQQWPVGLIDKINSL
jgi:tripartite ATP-independent transporter DctP family solute receptor